MTDAEVRCITASCSFPDEEPTTISVPITGERLSSQVLQNCLLISVSNSLC
jgi:hypothetical protein